MLEARVFLSALVAALYESRNLLVLLSSFLVPTSPLLAQLYQGRPIVESSLVADTTAIVPGKPFRLGLHLKIAPGWHVYWKNPGDSGIATEPGWDMPEGFTAGSLQWPLPMRIEEPGDIDVYAYRNEVMLIAEVTPPKEFNSESARLRAKPKWLVCEQICIPGSAQLELVLPVSHEAAPANTDLFAKFTAQLPRSSPPPFGMAWTRTATGWNLALSDIVGAGSVDFYPYANEKAPVGHTTTTQVVNGSADLPLIVDGSPEIEGVVLSQNGERRGWIVSSKEKKVAATVTPEGKSPGLLRYLLLGLIGGFILNLMPCVLPVISLKIFGFMRQAGDSRARILQHGLVFAAGVFVWFLGLAAVIVALKSGGHQVTWAFQFQNPWFNFLIGAVVFVFALNLFGVFEIVLPGRATQGIAEAGSHGGLTGSFAQGVLATLLATPCTAPFLGTALGFAFSQSAFVIFAMFAAVAAGMALPYVLLSAQPGWMKYLPKPGGWMERLKQFMGFPLLATLLWLLYVVGQQRGTEAIIWASASYLFLGLAAWLYGAFLGPMSSTRAKTFAALGIAISLFIGLGYFAGNLFARAAAYVPEKSAASAKEGMPWVPYSEAELQRLLGEGKSVFLDFTADWCITCKFNMRTAIDTPAVRAAFAKLGVVPLLADWTNSNPEITRKLAQFDRVGVPFYLFYPPGRANDPVVLPELLTEQIVLRAVGAQP